MFGLSGNTAFVVIVFLIVAFFFIRNLVNTIFNVDKMDLDKEREKQLRGFDTSSKEAEEAAEIEQMRNMIDTLTNPFTDFVAERADNVKVYNLNRKLRFTEWDKYFTAYSFTAFVWILRILGVAIAAGLYSVLEFLSLIIGAILIIMPAFLLNNTYTNKQDELMTGFPEMINIISGYLSANMLFTEAVKNALPHISEAWKPTMEKFIIKANLSSVEEALDWLVYSVDIGPIKEFVSIVKLNLELGNSVKDSFTEQADKIREMLAVINEKKIQKRKSMATMVQAPLLLCIIAAFALPTVGSIIDIM